MFRRCVPLGLILAALALAPALADGEGKARTPSYGRYRVQPGDTLRSISRRLLGDPHRWQEIFELNQRAIGADPNHLKRDILLLVPIPEERLGLVQKPIETGEETPGNPAVPAVPAPTPSPFYVVKPGDTLIGIARKELGNPSLWKELYRQNRQALGDDPGRLNPGTSLAFAGASPSPSPRARSYEVKKGDTLRRIAREQCGEVAAWKRIYEDNRQALGENPDVLKPGLRLRLPGEQCAPPPPSAPKVYLVKPGDTLIGIARRELGNPSLWKELYRLNQQKLGDDPGCLCPGTSLVLPSSGG